MRGEDLRKLKEEEDEERERREGEGEEEEKDSVALVAEERKRDVEEAEEEEAAATATAVPKTVAAMDLVGIEYFEGEAIGDECDEVSVVGPNARPLFGAFFFFTASSLLLFWINLAYSNQPCLATCLNHPSSLTHAVWGRVGY